MNDYKLNINGKEHKVKADAQMPMLWVIRDLLGMTGTKFGCGKGLCGACTIHLNGKAVRSCQTPISKVKNALITTIEGLGKNNPVVKAWAKLRVPQCGYCQPGQVMQAVSFLKSDVRKTEKNIRKNMQGNICRCGCYPRIVAAVADAAKGGSTS